MNEVLQSTASDIPYSLTYPVPSRYQASPQDTKSYVVITSRVSYCSK